MVGDAEDGADLSHPVVDGFLCFLIPALMLIVACALRLEEPLHIAPPTRLDWLPPLAPRQSPASGVAPQRRSTSSPGQRHAGARACSAGSAAQRRSSRAAARECP